MLVIKRVQKLLHNRRLYATKLFIKSYGCLKMIIDSNNKKQKSILTNKCFYQTTARIMRDFEERGYANSADETAKVIAAYHDIVKKKTKNNFSNDYNNAFKRIDTAIQSLANQVFYDCDKKSLDYAYHSFEEFDHIGAIVTRQRAKKGAL